MNKLATFFKLGTVALVIVAAVQCSSVTTGPKEGSSKGATQGPAEGQIHGVNSRPAKWAYSIPPSTISIGVN